MNIPASKAKVMLVDDHAMLRYGMAMLINLEPDMEVFAEACDCGEALATLKAGLHPDIVLMDVSLKTHSGLGVIKNMHNRIPALPVLVVSLHDEAIYAERALRAGARGYVMKQEPGKVLVIAIREVLKGHYYLSKPMQARLLNRVITGNSETEPLISLTSREFEVLHLIGSGNSSADLMRYAAHWISEEH
jgi:DNA-binding NarL/FixJ family response regulator